MSARVLLVRGNGRVDADLAALAAAGVPAVSDPYLNVRTCDDRDAPHRAQALLNDLDHAESWLIATSANGVWAIVDLAGRPIVEKRLIAAERAGARFAAVGPTSAQALQELGVREVLVPSRQHTASALLASLDELTPGVAVLPRSDIADALLPDALRTRGWAVHEHLLYRTETVNTRPQTAPALAEGAFEVLVLRSPSAVRAVRTHAMVAASTAVVAGGPTTALAARRAGIEVCAVAHDSTPSGIARTVARVLDDRAERITSHG